jgi:AcrR family transcriptional regulator
MGRPREFDIDEAIDIALDLFWRNGYEKTSLSDLTGALKISPPSFYFAFGSKEQLFKKALDRYASVQIRHFEEALRQPTSLGVATLLR